MNKGKIMLMIVGWLLVRFVKTIPCQVGFSEFGLNGNLDLDIFACNELIVFEPMIKNALSTIRTLHIPNEKKSLISKIIWTPECVIKGFIEALHKKFVKSSFKPNIGTLSCLKEESLCETEEDLIVVMLLNLLPPLSDINDKLIVEATSLKKISILPKKSLEKVYQISKETFQEENELFGKLFINNYWIILSDFISDYELIQALFFPSKEYKLGTIKIMDSDIHKETGLTSLLVLHEGSKELKIMYKPSSVLADFIITGDIIAFCECTITYFKKICQEKMISDKRSFFQIILEEYKKDKEQDLNILIYKILPIEMLLSEEATVKNEQSRIYFAHGYTEFIHHQFEDFPLSSAISGLDIDKIYKNSQSNDMGKDLQNAMDKTFDKWWFEKNKNIIDIQKNLWTEIGIGISALLFLASTDGHSENILITDKGKIAFIDLEASFSHLDSLDQEIFSGTTPSLKTLLDPNGGGLNFFPKKLTESLHLLKTNGKKFIKIKVSTYEQNNIFYLTNEKKAEVVKYDSQKFNIGLEYMYQLYANQKFDHWISSGILNKVIIRNVPVSTIVWIKLTKEINQEIDNQINQLAKIVVESPVVHEHLIYNDHTKKLLKKKIIPAFYTVTDSNNLYFADTQIIENETEKQGTISYFKTSSIEIFKKRIQPFLEGQKNRNENINKIMNLESEGKLKNFENFTELFIKEKKKSLEKKEEKGLERMKKNKEKFSNVGKKNRNNLL